ncbi:MAG: eukaryotic-like serine/threonine-protein kinase [Solirubrobacteraceae bacterium]|nr:eukaryotic-like serine/threonine-protein kinase [Solirubrobacteraceae bacterium]
MTDGPPPAEPGTELAAGYEVLGHLARGEALDVYDVWSVERECHCVAKVLRPDRSADPGPRRRLLREGRILLGFAHPHIVRAYELLRGPVLILETLTGGSVNDAIKQASRRLPLPAIAQLGVHLCSAAHYLHRHGLLHADIKPANVMMDRGFSKLIDFSLASKPGRAVRGRGTRAYMAPEQARGGHISAATDVWGIGTVLWSATVGRAPFPSERGHYAQLEATADRVDAHRRLPRSHAAMADAIASCLEPDPARRPPVGVLIDILDDLLED